MLQSINKIQFIHKLYLNLILKEINKMKLLITTLLACTILLSGCSQTASSESLENSTSVATSDTSSLSDYIEPQNIEKENELQQIKFNIDFDTAIANVIKSVSNLEEFPFLEYITIEVDELFQEIYFGVSVLDGTDKTTATMFADTIIKMFNEECNLQDNAIKSSNQSYYGGLYDTYEMQINVAEKSKISRLEYWLVSERIPKATHNPIKPN